MLNKVCADPTRGRDYEPCTELLDRTGRPGEDEFSFGEFGDGRESVVCVKAIAKKTATLSPSSVCRLRRWMLRV